MPGTYNCKPAYGEHAPRVTFVKADFDRVYNYSALEEVVNDWLYAQRGRGRDWGNRRGKREQTPESTVESSAADVRARFNQEHSLVDLLRTHGYVVSFQHGAQTRLARPGRDGQHSSITVFAAHDDTPERSIHFSTNDPLYSTETVNEQTGQLRRRVYDAFAVYARLEHGGDWQAAYATVAGQRAN